MLSRKGRRKKEERELRKKPRIKVRGKETHWSLKKKEEARNSGRC